MGAEQRRPDDHPPGERTEAPALTDFMDDVEFWTPPPGERHYLSGRGTTFVRAQPGPEGAPTVVLLHGWLATGALNWQPCFDPLSQHFNVLAPDHRGHGRGIRSARRFRLADCADDVAALIELRVGGPVILVGYSMGGPIAQLVWKRHRHLVSGMVLAATGVEFVPGNRERYAASALLTVLAGTTRVGSLASFVPATITRRLVGLELSRDDPGRMARWARREMSRHNVRMVLEAGHAIMNYSAKRWIGEVDVPVSVLVTEDDTAVAPEGQLRMAMAIPGAHVNRIADGHTACMNPDFGRKITDAVLDVQRRIEAGVGSAVSHRLQMS